MNVNVLQSKNPYLNGVNTAVQNAKKISNLVKPKELAPPEGIANAETKTNIAKGNENIISNSEMKYFQKLFPENSAQIEKHILFNRNGKVVESNLNKGTFFDGKI